MDGRSLIFPCVRVIWQYLYHLVLKVWRVPSCWAGWDRHVFHWQCFLMTSSTFKTSLICSVLLFLFALILIIYLKLIYFLQFSNMLICRRLFLYLLNLSCICLFLMFNGICSFFIIGLTRGVSIWLLLCCFQRHGSWVYLILPSFAF